MGVTFPLILRLKKCKVRLEMHTKLINSQSWDSL